MKKLMLILTIIGVSNVASAQSLDLTYGVGRTYDIPMEQWQISNIPGLEFNWKNLQVQLFAQFNTDFTVRTEADINIVYEKRLTEKVSMSLNYGEYHYPQRSGFDFKLPTDRLFYVEGKLRLWERKPKSNYINIGGTTCIKYSETVLLCPAN